MKKILKIFTDSPKKKIPKIITPIAPIAVQQAYAVPIGIVLNEKDKKIKLKIMNITVKTANNSLVKFSENFNANTHPISKIPAITK